MEWVSALLIRFEDQLPCRVGPPTLQSRLNVQQNKESLIHISRFKFSMVISGLTKTLSKISEMKPPAVTGNIERDYHESLLIVLDTLEKCLSHQAAHHRGQIAAAAVGSRKPQPSTPASSEPQVKQNYDEIMNVKLLLKEICLFIDMQPSLGASASVSSACDSLVLSCSSNYNMVTQIRALASKVLFALSVNNFGAVFSRISGRLQELSVSNEENPDNHTDIELIQHIDVNIGRLVKLLTEAISKFKSLKNNARLPLMASLEKAIWNWMDNYRKFSLGFFSMKALQCLFQSIIWILFCVNWTKRLYIF